jgi:hypothetical protein
LPKPRSKNEWYKEVYQNTYVGLYNTYIINQKRLKLNTEHIIPGLLNGSSLMELVWFLPGGTIRIWLASLMQATCSIMVVENANSGSVRYNSCNYFNIIIKQ